MATYSAGIAAAWGAVTFTEITDLSWNYGGANISREANGFHASPLGAVSISSLGVAPSKGDVGRRETLTIGGGGVGLTVEAVLKSVGVVAELNGVTTISCEFDIVG